MSKACERCQKCAFYAGNVHGEEYCKALLQLIPENEECRFFKTPEELYESQLKAYNRLVDNKMDSVIAQYNVHRPVKYAGVVEVYGG